MGQLGQALSEQEETLLRMFATGITEKMAANILDEAKSAIDKRCQSIRAKLGAKTMMHAMHIWTMRSPVMERLVAQLGRPNDNRRG
mgnify:CR=1 FL=1